MVPSILQKKNKSELFQEEVPLLAPPKLFSTYLSRKAGYLATIGLKLTAAVPTMLLR
jgi:hypothetical protein